ncbi:hypothetical protein BC629DRAFT_1436386 [Irpex lacteus]|nr:hypothetical protein BC629DRAFT_1436386 [Irpex lacteus]
MSAGVGRIQVKEGACILPHLAMNILLRVMKVNACVDISILKPGDRRLILRQVPVRRVDSAGGLKLSGGRGMLNQQSNMGCNTGVSLAAPQLLWYSVLPSKARVCTGIESTSPPPPPPPPPPQHTTTNTPQHLRPGVSLPRQGMFKVHTKIQSVAGKIALCGWEGSACQKVELEAKTGLYGGVTQTVDVSIATSIGGKEVEVTVEDDAMDVDGVLEEDDVVMGEPDISPIVPSVGSLGGSQRQNGEELVHTQRAPRIGHLAIRPTHRMGACTQTRTRGSPSLDSSLNTTVRIDSSKPTVASPINPNALTPQSRQIGPGVVKTGEA